MFPKYLKDARWATLNHNISRGGPNGLSVGTLIGRDRTHRPLHIRWDHRKYSTDLKSANYIVPFYDKIDRRSRERDLELVAQPDKDFFLLHHNQNGYMMTDQIDHLDYWLTDCGYYVYFTQKHLALHTLAALPHPTRWDIHRGRAGMNGEFVCEEELRIPAHWKRTTLKLRNARVFAGSKIPLKKVEAALVVPTKFGRYRFVPHDSRQSLEEVGRNQLTFYPTYRAAIAKKLALPDNVKLIDLRD